MRFVLAAAILCGSVAISLAKCKPARTVLVLENRDMALSNHWVISDCLEMSLSGRTDLPDEVWRRRRCTSGVLDFDLSS